MIIFKKKEALQAHLHKMAFGERIGFVPTMGALHQGHFSLIAAARQQCSLVISSIFVNPTQFNDPKDFEHYPITLDTDIDGLMAAGCDILFLPDVAEMYPEGLSSSTYFELGTLETLLEGAYRPGHFQGVCRIVAKLLQAVNPQLLYLGKKDYQQCMVISQLVKLLDLPVAIVISETLREQDGLAMSSRNRRLSPQERAIAPEIYQTLVWIKQQINKGETASLLDAANARLVRFGFKPDYISIANAETLAPIANWNGTTPIVALVAAYLGTVRLIDNLVLS
jgi:pantoate--beta-alanine ligase